jgi:integral membrane protein
MLKNALEQFRLMGFLEGTSLLVLLFIAMPLKYGFDLPEVVSVVGAIHGGLFTIYCAAIVYVTFVVKWPFRFAVGAVAVAFIPFGNFVLDSRLKNWKKAQAA